LLEGTWRELLDERVRTLVGTLRRDAWGETSLAINPLANICRELSVLYDTPPDIRHDIAPIDDLSNRVRVSGLWPMMQRVQYYTRGLGNMLVRADASKDGSLTYRPVFPDMSTAQAKPERPDIPVAVQEFRERTVDGQREWTCDVLDVSDPENPVYRVILIRNTRDGNGKSSDEQTDITAKVLGADMSGDAYPYRRRDGTPVLPYVLYHATRNGYRLWQPYEWMELVEGTLDAAVLHQMLMHTWRDASWPQRYTVNLSVRGGGAVQTTDGRPSGAMVTDPASLLEFESPVDREENTQPMVGQFQPGGDIAVMERGIADFVARLAQSADVPPSDIQRMTGQAQSGAAISLNNEGKRSAQRRYAESFRDSDERLMMVRYPPEPCNGRHSGRHRLHRGRLPGGLPGNPRVATGARGPPRRGARTAGGRHHRPHPRIYVHLPGRERGRRAQGTRGSRSPQSRHRRAIATGTARA
jgi:hypothetical protein